MILTNFANFLNFHPFRENKKLSLEFFHMLLTFLPRKFQILFLPMVCPLKIRLPRLLAHKKAFEKYNSTTYKFCGTLFILLCGSRQSLLLQNFCNVTLNQFISGSYRQRQEQTVINKLKRRSKNFRKNSRKICNEVHFV